MPLPSYLQLPACSESPSPVGGGEGGPLPYLTSAQCPAIATHLAGPTYVGPQVGFGCDAIFGIEVMAQAACLPLSKVLGWVGPPEAGGQALRASATPPPAGCMVNWDGSPGSACLYSGWWDLPGPPPIKSQGRATTHSVPRCAASQQHMLARPPPPPPVACQLPGAPGRKQVHTPGSGDTFLPHRYFLGISHLGRPIRSVHIAWKGGMVKDILTS